MSNYIIDKMFDRVARAKDISDASYFDELLLLGEFLLKITTSYIVAGLNNGVLRGRYKAEYKIMHSTGLGTWAETLDDILTGTLSTHIIKECSLLTSEITQKTSEPSLWQYKACKLLENIFDELTIPIEKPAKKSLRYWFRSFVILRNKTKGHGAYQKGVIGSIAMDLESSLFLLVENMSLASVDSSFIYLMLNKKYRISRISSTSSRFDFLKEEKQARRMYPDGAYAFYDKPRIINLIHTDQDLSDVFLPNGKNGTNCELLSYITGRTKYIPLEPYCTPPDDLPFSETYGLNGLDVQGNIFSNAPALNDLYIRRDKLEREVKDLLLDSRHPVITLSGKGGIGKTSTIISILHDFFDMPGVVFDVVLWFSSRDIDLLDEGPKPVKMGIATKDDICKQYIDLMAPESVFKTTQDKIDFFVKELQNTTEGKGKVFVFDNFETLNDPESIFHWINTHVRLPNKIVITTRFRNFKGDYPVEVKGMTKEEAFELIESHANQLKITELVDREYANTIFEWSEGHPYIIKVLLGQVATAQRHLNPKTVFAGNDDILNALFERTYSILTPTAVRVYLTLCRWKSDMPEAAVKAVLARPTRAIADITEAIDELINFSMVESFDVEGGKKVLICPAASRAFGERKLKVSPDQLAIDQDVKILMTLGASKHNGFYDFYSKIFAMLTSVLRFQENAEMVPEDVDGIIDYLSEGYPRTLMIAGGLWREKYPELSFKYFSKFIEISSPFDEEITVAWGEIARCAERLSDGVAFINAKAQLALKHLENNFERASWQINLINRYVAENQQQFIQEQENKIAILKHLAEKMLDYIEEHGNADDCSRVAWLLLYCGLSAKAQQVIARGLEIDSENPHCMNLKRRLDGYT